MPRGPLPEAARARPRLVTGNSTFHLLPPDYDRPVRGGKTLDGSRPGNQVYPGNCFRCTLLLRMLGNRPWLRRHGGLECCTRLPAELGFAASLKRSHGEFDGAASGCARNADEQVNLLWPRRNRTPTSTGILFVRRRSFEKREEFERNFRHAISRVYFKKLITGYRLADHLSCPYTLISLVSRLSSAEFSCKPFANFVTILRCHPV